MESVSLVCRPRFEDISTSSEVFTVLNLDSEQLSKLLGLNRKMLKALSKSGISKESFHSICLEDDLTFWLTSLPGQVSEEEMEEADEIGDASSEDYQWRVFFNANLDDDQMNIDCEPLDMTTMEISNDGICFAAYIKHNSIRYETAMLPWEDLFELRDKMVGPPRKAKLKK